MSLLSPVLVLLVTLSMLFGAGASSHTTTSAERAQDHEWSSDARIAATMPLADTLAVADGEGLHLFSGDGWQTTDVAPPPGELAMSEDDPAVLLAGDKADCMRGDPGDPLHRSDDGGKTWTPVNGDPEIQPLAIWEAEGLAIGASCTGLEISEDGGLTWTVLPGIDPGWDVTSFAVVPQAGEAGPVVLAGLTGEGGTSNLHSIDLSDPGAPVVSDSLRMYYAIGGLAGAGNTYVLAAMDGTWLSHDSGATWTRSAEGLEDIVLDEDPAEAGLPEDVDPRMVGLTTLALMPDGGLMVGSADGLFSGWLFPSEWVKVEGTSGRVDQLAVSSDGSLALYRADDIVRAIPISAT